ncbi:MAG: copper chaperone PCu(A)C [Burkholderiaceae bacterium]|nr:MAG: copper chaperone PCu(A)C [Burkholderiaceae bacterium]
MTLPLIISTIFTLNFPFVIANDAAEKIISISGGHTNVIRPGQSMIAVYVDAIKNSTNKDVDLIAISSPSAKNIEIHSMQIVNNVMKMKKEEKITIPAKSKVSLGKKSPNGYHLMVFGVSPQITEKSMFTINLSFSNGEKLQTEISVKKHTENQRKHH